MYTVTQDTGTDVNWNVLDERGENVAFYESLFRAQEEAASMIDAASQARSFKVAVKTRSDKEWVYNGVRYSNAWAASAAGSDLAARWFAVTEWEVHPSGDEPNA